jgi:hypothetical protein
MKNGGASLYLHGSLTAVGAGLRVARPLTPNLSLYAEGEAGWRRSTRWNPYAQAIAGIAVRF